MKRIIYIFCTVFFLFSCVEEKENGKSVKTIEINFDENNKVPNIKIKSVIPLETNDTSLIGITSKLSVFKKHLYLLDTRYNKALFLFDMDGNFIRKTLRGKGPGEMIYPHDFFIDKKNKKIYVLDTHRQRINVYDLNLKFLHKIETVNRIASYGIMLPDSSWLCYANSPYRDVNNWTNQRYMYYIYNKNFTEVENRLIPSKRKYSGWVLRDPITNSNYPQLFSCVFDLVVYSIDEFHHVNKAYNIDFGKYNVSESDLDNRSMDYIMDKMKKNEIITHVFRISKNNQFVCFHYFHKDRPEKYFIYSKPTGDVFLCQNIVGNNLLPKGFIGDIYNDTFVLSIEPSDFKTFCKENKRFKKYLSNVKNEASNPILLTFKIVDKNE
ncbi:MAG: 6-bladed beta-propeller [Bacteroidota bacterium]